MNKNVVTIAQFRDLIEAQLAKGKLDSAGISSYLGNENIVSLDWFYSNAVGGVRLLVGEEDAETAREILAEPIPEELVDEESGAVFVQPRCPRCDSLDVGFESIDRTLSYGLMFLSVAIPVAKNNWKCYTCGAEWTEE